MKVNIMPLVNEMFSEEACPGWSAYMYNNFGGPK